MADAGQPAEEEGAKERLYHQIMRLKEVHYLATFALIYVGTEVSIGGEAHTRGTRDFGPDFMQVGLSRSSSRSVVGPRAPDTFPLVSLRVSRRLSMCARGDVSDTSLDKVSCSAV